MSIDVISVRNIGRHAMAALALFGVLALASCTTTPTEETAISDRPNILIVLVDDMGWGDVGYHGSEIATPTIDALASRSAILDRAYSYPICSPTRAALLTGQNPLHHGIDGPLLNTARLPHELTLLPEYLKAVGYDTQMVGKWHLGMETPEDAPDARGFDNFFGTLGGFADYYLHTYFGGYDLQRDGVPERREGYLTDIITEEALQVLDRAARDPDPLFMYLSYTAPHTPLQYPPGARDSYAEIEDANRRVYAQMVTYFDRSLGQVLQRLEENGMAQNTIVIFLSDNGGLEGPGGALNDPLRGRKGQAFEGGIRVPGLISWPGRIAPRVVDQGPVFVQDWVPTLLSALNVAYDPADFYGQTKWAMISQDSAFNDDRPTPVIVGTSSSIAAFAWPYKLIRNTNRQTSAVEEQMFNVVADPAETRNILGQNTQLASRLRSAIEALPPFGTNSNQGPPPEHLFLNPDGTTNFEYRMEEECDAWADAARGRSQRPCHH